MTANAKCDFPGCQNVAHHYDSFFKKWDCPDHAFDKVVWPELGNEHRIEQKMKEESLREYDRQLMAEHKGAPYKPKKNSHGAWGKKYFK